MHIEIISYCRTSRVITSNILLAKYFVCNVIYEIWNISSLASNIVSQSISFVAIYKQYRISEYFVLLGILYRKIFRAYRNNIVLQNISCHYYQYCIAKYFVCNVIYALLGILYRKIFRAYRNNIVLIRNNSKIFRLYVTWNITKYENISILPSNIVSRSINNISI